MGECFNRHPGGSERSLLQHEGRHGTAQPLSRTLDYGQLPEAAGQGVLARASLERQDHPRWHTGDCLPVPGLLWQSPCSELAVPTRSNGAICASIPKKRWCRRAACRWDFPPDDYDYDYDYAFVESPH